MSGTVNFGYNIPLHSGWFVEPSAGLVLSRVSVDTLNVAGNTVNVSLGRPGFVSIPDIESTLMRLSFTVGKNFTLGGVTWQPYFTASVFHEPEGDNATATSVIDSKLPVDALITGESLTARSFGGVGTYGQYALGTAAVLGNSGWLGYVRGDYRQGDHIEGWSVTGGLRWQFNPVNAPLK